MVLELDLEDDQVLFSLQIGSKDKGNSPGERDVQILEFQSSPSFLMINLQTECLYKKDIHRQWTEEAETTATSR